MIKFSCDKCGHKLGVRDELAGKRGNCPKCQRVVVVPEKSILVGFVCESCGEKISAIHTRAGKKGKCPKCKTTLAVPIAHDLTLLDPPTRYEIQDQPTGPSSTPEESIEQESEEDSAAEGDKSAGDRNLPWPIDIFLYPTSAAGLTHLAIFTVIPLLVAVVGTLLGAFGILGLIADIAIGLYFCWYITECVRDSAMGGTRAPEAFATADLGELWLQAQHIIGCYLIFVGPVGFYHIFTERTDVVFWLLLAYGVLFLPMGLLACVMFDSIRGLNPVLLIASIFSTIVQYCGFVLLIGGVILILVAITSVGADQTQGPSVGGLILDTVFYGLSVYAALIVSHLLGRFYWRNEEKLSWEV